MSLDLSAEDRKALAKDLAAELDTGRYGSRFVLSRRQLLSIAGGSAGVAGLVALGVDPATAQSAAGQVGTQSSPEDVFAFDLDVQGGAEFNGNDLSGVGSLSTDDLSLTGSISGQTIVYADVLENRGGSWHATQVTGSVGTSASRILDVSELDFSRGFGQVLVSGKHSDGRFYDVVEFGVGEGLGPNVVRQYEPFGTPAARSYSREANALELSLGSGSADVGVNGNFSIFPDPL